MSYLITIIVCFLIIYLVDQLIKYGIENYTTKKTKDIVGHQIKKYQHLMDDFHKVHHHSVQENNENIENPLKLTNSDLIAMNEELNSLITEDMF
jgi:ATP adenylyltransferase/5',5'''-P-1,P-4-tetraphosphate phosphorylase II